MYQRYIEDVILGLFTHEVKIFHKILETFNSINPSISFTVDIPVQGKFLNFLDNKIIINENGLNEK